MCRCLSSFLFSLIFSGCAFFDTTLPVLGQVVDGVYTDQRERFSCPLLSESLGLNNIPKITDAIRIVHTKDIPLSQRAPSDTRRVKIVSDEIKHAGTVIFSYASGTTIEISSGKRFPRHKMKNILRSGMTGGFTWPFNTREVESPMSHMMSLQLVPWYGTELGYMGINIQAAYAQGQGADVELWIINNIATEVVHHNVIFRLPLAPLLTTGVNLRNLPDVREDIRSRPELQLELLEQAKVWLSGCDFSEEM